ncbi:MAG: thioredoxin domain-containing protein, partial [Candidatus Aminicenantes bacterium]|nr:thioredoxin domain-containing protein [Candidatus Aminicenantes bacterium]
MQNKKANRLIEEKSPYLQQHAYNPVNWYPWGETAFQKAVEEDKPVFLSIGYSTCHWCHVMERESFEDDEVADLLNRHFVSIKVDREERPDIDAVYIHICQMMTGRAGWPLTMVMTPDKKPFFSGTYFPRESRIGQTGLLDILSRIISLWRNRREDMQESAAQIIEAGRDRYETEEKTPLTEEVFTTAFRRLEREYDGRNGGFGLAPKFPLPHRLSVLLRYGRRTGKGKAMEMTEHTLQRMRMGGIYDQIGFGFHRYSTDDRWFIPHFEKMIYDQALLAPVYTEAFLVTKNPEYRKTALEILTYVEHDMTSTEGAFFSAEDADSEGKEGRFYTWTTEEIRHHLSKGLADLAIRIYQMEEGGNFRDESGGEQSGGNILHPGHDSSEFDQIGGMSREEWQTGLETIRTTLFEVRNRRPRPLRDEKILADWNGLMITAFARASAAFDRKDLCERAERAADFIWKTMRNEEGRLVHRWRDGEAAVSAFADDSIFFTRGLIDLFELTQNPVYLSRALDLSDNLDLRFWDDAESGYFFTAHDAETLLFRKKESADGAVPSGNSVALSNLFRLARLTGRSTLEEKAQRLAGAFA